MFIFRLIANGLAPLTLLGAIAAYLFPELFLPFKHVFIWLFAITMFALGMVLDAVEFKDTLRHPLRFGLGVLTQYAVMPTLAFLVAGLAGLPPAVALGFIIVGSAPGAMASNVIVYLAGGAMAFSIAMTTVATFLSPLVTPTLVEVLGGRLLPIPFWNMMQTILLVVVLPLGLGMFLSNRAILNLAEYRRISAPILIQIQNLSGWVLINVGASVGMVCIVSFSWSDLLVAITSLGLGLTFFVRSTIPLIWKS